MKKWNNTFFASQNHYSPEKLNKTSHAGRREKEANERRKAGRKTEKYDPGN